MLAASSFFVALPARAEPMPEPEIDATARDQSSGEVSVQRFNPAPGPRNLITTRRVRSAGEMTYSLGLLANYALKPFRVRSCEEPAPGETTCANAATITEVPVVESLMSADLMATLTPIEILQLGLRLPVTWVSGDGLEPSGLPVEGGISGTGIGDTELEAKARLYGSVDSPIAFGGALFLTAPLGKATAEGKYIGDETAGVGARVILDGVSNALFWGANAGGVWRGKARVGVSELGPEFRYGFGAGYQVSETLAVMGDAFGATNFTTEAGASSMELDAAVRTKLTPMLALSGGLGTGIIDGVGVPQFRAFVGVSYVVESIDTDQDGLQDDVDQCPTEPEDLDNHQDGDGCPDADNDFDSIPDSEDKCPSQEEDRDGFEDEDGCPDVDNDDDGIPDTGDRCPDEPETVNKFKDGDGCPDVVDYDEDGVPDDKDQCKDEMEDTDGFEDTDGCPEPDNDQDGILDENDECLDEPETKNNRDDEDGCPD